MKTFSFSQWVKFELTLYKNQQFATKQDQHFVLTNIPVLDPPLPFGKMQSSTSWVLHLLTPFFSSAFALWANAELYILGPSLTPFLPSFLPFSGRKLKISVNIDARTLKFCMSHPWTKSLRFRENQIVCMSLSLLVDLFPY